MPRNPAGAYVLPNPDVVGGNTILALDENTTRHDLETEMTASLDRQGRGGMLAPLRIYDGSLPIPGLAFENDQNSGIYRETADTWHAVAGGVSLLRFDPSSLGIGAAFINRSGGTNKGLSFDLQNGAAFKADTHGNIVTWASGGASGKSGRLHADATSVGIYDSGANGITIASPGGAVSVLAGGATRATFGGTNALTVLGNISVPVASGVYFDSGVNTFISSQPTSATLQFIVNATERLRLNASTNPQVQVSGNLSVNAGSNIYLDGGGDTWIDQLVADQIRLVCGGAARLSVGTTISTFATELDANSATTIASALTCANASPNGLRLSFSAAAPNNGGANYFLLCVDTVGNKAIIASNGGFLNFQANDVNLSDVGVKVLLNEPMISWRKKVRALHVRMARYKDSPEMPPQPMLIAQQVNDHFPELVVPFSDGLLGVKEHAIGMYHLLVTQEHDDIIEDLKSRLATLEGKFNA